MGLGLAGVVLGCGPAVATTGAGTTGAATGSSTGGDGETTSPAPPATTDATPPPPATVTTSPPGTSGVDTGDDTGWESYTGSSSGDPYACGCPPNTDVAFEEVVDGWSAEQALENFPPLTLPFYWHALVDAEPTTMTASVAYAGGAIELGPGGDDGCNFLSSPCLSGFRIEVAVEMSTADGRFAGTFEGVLQVPDPDEGLTFMQGLDVAMLPAQVEPPFEELPFEFEGKPVPLGDLYSRVTWGSESRFNEPTVQLQSIVRGDGYLLGSSYPPR